MNSIITFTMSANHTDSDAEQTEKYDLAEMQKLLSDVINVGLTSLQDTLDAKLAIIVDGSNQSMMSGAADMINDTLPTIEKLERVMKHMVSHVTQAKKTCETVLDTHKKNLESQIQKLNTRNNAQVKPKTRVDNVSPDTSWADLTDDIVDNVPPSWATITKNSKSQPRVTPPLHTTAFAVNTKRESEETWMHLTIPTINVELSPGGIRVNLPYVENDKQLKSLPNGMLVYHRGKKIPKIVLTTGKANYPSVPLGCRMWDMRGDEETLTKYSRYNSKISRDNSPDVSSFYVDERASALTGHNEDTSRNFRTAMRFYPNDDRDTKNSRTWCGYSVYKMPTFGDANILDTQMRSVSLDDAADLYQYSLWMMIVSLAHFQNRNV